MRRTEYFSELKQDVTFALPSPSQESGLHDRRRADPRARDRRDDGDLQRGAGGRAASAPGPGTRALLAIYETWKDRRGNVSAATSPTGSTANRCSAT